MEAGKIGNPLLSAALRQSRDGPVSHACKLGARKHRIEGAWLALPLRPVAALDQEQESGGTGGETRGGGGLDVMTRRVRRRSETVRFKNERDFPHVAEIALPPERFCGVLLEIYTVHRERRIPGRRGRNRHEGKQVYIR